METRELEKERQIMKSFFALGFLALFLTACAPVETDLREQTSHRMAMPAFMTRRDIDTKHGPLAVWERIHTPGAAVHVYIEGDAPPDPIHDLPTPENPVALDLASRDHASNLVWIARPCQYRTPETERTCEDHLSDYREALTDIRERYDVTEFHVIGYDSGAVIAAELALSDPHVISLRTVAGRLDRLLPRAGLMADIPQQHFIGAGDSIATADMYHRFRQAMGYSECIRYTFVQDADHTSGWVQKWPELLKIEPECPRVYKDLAPLPSAPDYDYNSHGAQIKGK